MACYSERQKSTKPARTRRLPQEDLEDVLDRPFYIQNAELLDESHHRRLIKVKGWAVLALAALVAGLGAWSATDAVYAARADESAAANCDITLAVALIFAGLVAGLAGIGILRGGEDDDAI